MAGSLWASLGLVALTVIASSMADAARAEGGPAIFVHEVKLAQGPLPDAYRRYVVPSKLICGAQLSLPWSAVETAPGRYDWSAVERAMSPWTGAGKKAAISFHGVAEAEGMDVQPIQATPGYVLSQVDTVACAANRPPTPVYIQPGYRDNWRRFIAAALVKYQDDPRVAYMRFGIGAGDESFVQGGMDGACVDAWASHGVTAESWTQYAIGLIDYIGSLHPRVQVAMVFNRLGKLRGHGDPDAYPRAITEEAAKFHFMVGNEGFTSDNSWSQIYGPLRGRTPLYMQTKSRRSLTGGAALTAALDAAQAAGISVAELYGGVVLAMLDPSNPDYAAFGDTYRTALAARGAACAIK